MPRWRNAAAAARPPMPAPMMVMERTGFLTADAALLFERDIGGLDHAAPVRNFLLDVGAECLGRAGHKLDLGGGGLEPVAQRACFPPFVHPPRQPVHDFLRGAGGREKAEPDCGLVARHGL